MGHVSAKHPAYKFMCDELNCFKVYISKPGLFKHKKTHVPEETDESVLCIDCQQTFKSEQDCENHNCPARTEEQKKSDVEDPKPKIETPENREKSSNGK